MRTPCPRRTRFGSRSARPQSPPAGPSRCRSRRRGSPRRHPTASVSAHGHPFASAAGVTVGGLDATGMGRLHQRLAAYVDSGEVPGLAALVARGSDVHTEVLGSLSLEDSAPLPRDAIFRIASLTKPMAAAGAMMLVDDGVLSVGDPA